MPIGTALAITGGASLLSGMMQADAASHAADLQAGAANNATALQKQMFDTQNQQQTGYRAAGQTSLSNIGALSTGQYQTYDQAGNPVGTPQTGSGYLQHQFNAQDLAAGLAPNYDFMLQQGQAANQRASNVGGGLLSGNTLQGLQNYTQDYAGNAYQNAFNNYQTQRGNIYNTLASIAGLGQTSLGQTTQAGTQAASNIGNSMMNAGSAQAGGIVGSANAISGGLQGAGNAYMLSSLLKPQTQTPTGYGNPVSNPLENLA